MPKSLFAALIIVCALIASPRVAKTQDTSAVDILQAGQRSETNVTLLNLMWSFYKLAVPVQERLLRARLTNARIEWRSDAVASAQCYGNPYNRENTRRFSSSRARKDTEEKRWYLMSAMLLDCYEVSKTNKAYSSELNLYVFLEIDVDASTSAWMKARTEYTEYSKETIREQDLVVHITATASGFEWKRQEPGDPFDHDENNDGLQFDLVLAVKSGTVERISWGGYTGTPAQHAKWLRAKTVPWVKFYMGEGPKPPYIVHAPESED
jgi:hypothetical protein